MILFENLPNDPKLAARIVQEQADDTKRQRDMGKIGVVLGSREYAAVYISSFIAIIFAIVIAVLVFVPASTNPDKIQEMQIVGGFFFWSRRVYIW